MKIRTGYVSNSSSSSFILDNKEDIKYFSRYQDKLDEVFSTNEIKKVIIEFIKDFTSNYDFEKEYELDFDEFWNKYFANKVPDYFKYYYISDWNIREWNFSSLHELLKELPNDKWLTDSYDRDWAYEYLPTLIKEYDSDL